MTTLKQQQEGVKSLVANVVAGDGDSFCELEGIVKPLMVHLSNYFSSLHHKFEFEDFYSICLNALYEACLEYDSRNPSFISYSKSFMLRQCWRELEYWNAEMRNIFENSEIQSDDIEKGWQESAVSDISVEEEILKSEFRENVNCIISDIFDDEKATVMRLYINKDMRPVDIARETGLHYKNTYSIIKRGLKRINSEYNKRFLDKSTLL